MGQREKTAILVDQPSTFVSTLGILVATLLFRGEQRWGQILKKFLFSPIYYFYSSLFVDVFGFDFKDWIQFILQKVGSGYSFSLVSVGFAIAF
jgi:hypothetical protein